jgi:ketosteroid isomerase-like protein
VSGAALDVARAYYDAWTGKDVNRAMSFIAHDIVCDAPAGRIVGAAAYQEFIGPFVGILERAEMIAAFGDDTIAVVKYDTDTVPVKNAPGAECVTVKDGKIVKSRFIFDRLPFQTAR